MPTGGSTAMPGTERCDTEQFAKEQQRRRDQAQRERIDAERRESLRYWREKARQAEEARSRAEQKYEEARQEFREHFKRKQEELLREAQRLRNEQHKRPGTAKARAFKPSAQPLNEAEEEESPEEQARRFKDWKEGYDANTRKAEARYEKKWKETTQTEIAKKAQHQDEFRAWSQTCKSLLKQPHSVTKLPEPPYTYCRQPGCAAPRYLKSCSHSVARAFAGANLNQSELASELRFWHPDRTHFRQIQEPYKDGAVKMAEEVFKAL